MTVSESLLQIAELTKQNLQILKVLNDSFYTKSNHLSTVVGETTYTIPSYIALENKVNHLQDAFNNLVHAAKSGETWFNFDGNSKEVLVRGYQSAPSPINLDQKIEFETEARTMFKDMLTPSPFLNFDMSSLPDDINQVKVKKIIPYAQDLQNRFIALSGIGVDGTAGMSWIDARAVIDSGDHDYIPGVDYLEYESVYTLPNRHCTRSGSYIIEEVLTDQITENLENVLTVRISKETPLVRTEYDGALESNLCAGDILTTFDGSAKLKIRSIQHSARILELYVMSGEYVNPIGAGENIRIQAGKTIFESVSDYAILNLFSSAEDNRQLHIPLEEDQYVYMTIAPINPRLNIQSQWGRGLFVNADKLIDATTKSSFRDYYNENVLNIGDAMIELATIAYPSITRFSQAEFNALKTAPNIIPDDDTEPTLNVVQINRHLNDSEAVKNIRALYAQKKQYQIDLSEVQGRIASLTESLAEISFDDMTGTRSAYTAQIADLKDQQNNLVTSINKIIDSISLAANNSEIPIENAKFRIRGYLDVERYVSQIAQLMNRSDDQLSAVRDSILGIQVRYRYRNPSIPQANVSVIGNQSFLFTEWEMYNPPLRERHMEYKAGSYKILRDDLNSDGTFNYSDNIQKFNQIDIPITQGEQVELQVRVLYGFGYPFVTVASDWSDAYVQEFPAELVTDVQVTTIIEENNNDIETNRFETILRTKGVTTHVDDAIDDQDIKFFHKPESISSGFYTPERRIIPLKDKLYDMNNDITELKDMIQGTTSEALRVTCVVDGVGSELMPDIDNVIQLPAYSLIQKTNEKIPTGSVWKDNNDIVYCPVTVTLSNITQHTIHLFSMFPGARTTFIDAAQYVRFPKDHFIFNNSGPGIIWTSDEDGTKAYKQRMNQVVTFRRTNPFDNRPLGPKGSTSYPQDANDADANSYVKGGVLLGTRSTDGTLTSASKYGLNAYPICPTEMGMCMTTDAVNAKLSLGPGESISFSIWTEYKLDSNSTTNSQSYFDLGFNVRNSLYTDALYYQIKFVAKYQQSTNDQMLAAKTNVTNLTKYNVTVR